MTDRCATNSAVIWVNFEIGKLYKISEDFMERKNFKSSTGGALRFFEEITATLSDTRNILILGPDETKESFRSYLVAKHPEIAKRVVACEFAEHPEDSEIAAQAAKYFQRPVA